MDCEFSLLIDFVQPDSLLQFNLRTNSARVAFLVNPLHREWKSSRETADFSHFGLQVVILDGMIDVSYEDLPKQPKTEMN